MAADNRRLLVLLTLLAVAALALLLVVRDLAVDHERARPVSEAVDAPSEQPTDPSERPAPTPSKPPSVALTPDSCRSVAPVPAPPDGCVTAEIRCGETIVSHTLHGIQQFDTRWWEENFCAPATRNHDGGDERVFRFRFPDVPAGEIQRARVWLDTPCADLDVMAMVVDDPDACPESVVECAAWSQDGTHREHADLVTNGQWADWFVVVEGREEEEGAFALTMQCDYEHAWRNAAPL